MNEQQNKKQLIFFDVDTQNDFMNADGALYVPGAELIKPNLKSLTDYALKNQIIIHGCVDRHFENDAELSENGGPFPRHCMNDTEGQKKIPETLVGNEHYVESGVNGLVPTEWNWHESVMGSKAHLIFEKQTYDVGMNRTLQLAKKQLPYLFLDITAIVYGVATEYCVKAASLELKSFGMDVFVVEDAIKEITLEGKLDTFKEFQDAGIKLTTTKRVLGGEYK